MAQFLRFRKEHNYEKRYVPSLDCPGIAITWFEAAEYCNWLSRLEGIREDQWCFLPNSKGEYIAGMRMAPNYLSLSGYRLPTEAEWEFACRAGSLTGRFFGESDELLQKYAWHADSSRHRELLPVGSLKPNDLGLFDMYGNALEWCLNTHASYPLVKDKITSEDAEGEVDIPFNVHRILRCGSFITMPDRLRSANRNWLLPTSKNGNHGFRLARTMKTE